jgi:hypothetical protein
MQTKTDVRLKALDGELWRRTPLALAGDLERLKRRVAAMLSKARTKRRLTCESAWV